MTGLHDAIRAVLCTEPPDHIKVDDITRWGRRDKYWCRLFADQRGAVFGDHTTDERHTWQADRDSKYRPPSMAQKQEQQRQRHATEQARNRRNRGRIRRLLQAGRRIQRGDICHRHIERRGLDADRIIGHPLLRCHDAIPHPSGNHYPGMLAPLYRGGRGRKTQRTYFQSDGSKAVVSPQRAMLVADPDHMGAALPIGTTGDLSIVAIGEGIENMLAVWMATGLPTAALCDAGNLERYQPPTATKTIFVAVDNDKSERGEQAFTTLETRLNKSRPDVQLVSVMTSTVGVDWDDLPQCEVRDHWLDVVSQEAAG